jgi:photosystem II stability/assembly factor-like uncharacterized protein
MRLIITLALFLNFLTSFSQWTRVQQLPSSDIFSLFHKDSILYAGGRNKVYISRDRGQTWDSTTTISSFILTDNIIVYKNELYASSYSVGVSKSTDEGRTWQNITAGIFPFVSDFCEFDGNLYAATLGGSIYKLDPVNRVSWLAFNDGLSSLSININSIAGNNNTLIAGTNTNGLYDYLPLNSTMWEERFLLDHINPTEGVYDIITAHDSLFLAGHTGKFYMSTDDGLNWNIFGNRISSVFTSIVNAKQALILSTGSFNGVNNTSFFYSKKDSLQDAFVPFGFVPDHFSYKLEIVGDKLLDASSRGLFYMPLSDLPGISDAEDSLATVLLPVHFVLFDVMCRGKTVLLNWETAQEQNSSHLNIERSPDGINWDVRLSKNYSHYVHNLEV